MRSCTERSRGGAQRVNALADVGGGPPMSSCAARPSAESVVSARGRGCRQDAVEAPAGGGSALEHPKLANAEGRVEGGWASRRGPDVFRQ